MTSFREKLNYMVLLSVECIKLLNLPLNKRKSISIEHLNDC